jgi:hypothetical protein
MPSAKFIYIGLIVPVSVLIPIVIAVINYRRIGKLLSIIFYYLLLDGFINVMAAVFANVHINNLPLLHIFTILEFLLLSFFYIKVLKEPLAHKVIKFLLVLFPLICVLNFIFFQSIYRFNTYTRPLEILIIMGYSLAYFAQTNESDNEKKWSSNALNWVNTGILLYFSGALFIYSFSNLTTAYTSPKYYALNLFIWNIHATLLLGMYLLFSWGFYICNRT